MTLQSVTESRAGSASANGLLARHIASPGGRVDRWDVLLCVGVFMLVVGVGLVVGAIVGVLVGIGSALGVGGLLFVMGGLWGARNSTAEAE